MPTRRQSPIPAQVHRHSKAPTAPRTRLIRLNLLLRLYIPDMNPTIAGCARKIPLIRAQRHSPYIAAARLSRREFPLQAPFFAAAAAVLRFGNGPDFDLAAEPDAGGYVAETAAGGAYVVAAEFVGVGDCL